MNRSQQESILIVDDEVEILNALRDFLTEIGDETERCTSGGVAVEVLKKRSFDLLITDLGDRLQDKRLRTVKKSTAISMKRRLTDITRSMLGGESST